MIIAGLEKLSLVDFPGTVCSIVFTQGCNFRCGYCQNPGLVSCLGNTGPAEEEVLLFLDHRRNMIDGLVITGGEPTIHPDLPEFIDKIREKGLKIKLDTNGAEPDMVEALFMRRKLDYIALDIKTSFDKYHLVTDKKDSRESVLKTIRTVMLSDVPYEFRMTCVPGIVNEEDLENIGEIIKGAKKVCLQQFRPDITLDDKFKEVQPYGKEDLQRFKGILLKYVEHVEIRGV